MTEIQNNLATNLKKRRQELGLTQECLAEKINSATTYISMIERCRKFPSPAMIERLASALETDSGSLFIGERTMDTQRNELYEKLMSGLNATFSK